MVRHSKNKLFTVLFAVDCITVGEIAKENTYIYIALLHIYYPQKGSIMRTICRHVRGTVRGTNTVAKDLCGYYRHRFLPITGKVDWHTIVIDF